MKKLAVASALIAAFGMTSVKANTQSDYESDDYQIYTGIGYGQYSFQWDDRENDTSFDEDAAMLKAYLGTTITPYWSVELGYENFDEASDIDSSAELDGVSLATRLSLPLNEHFSVYAKGGWLEWNADIHTDTPVVGRVSSEFDGGDWLYGAGLGLKLSEHVNMRVEYTRYKLEEKIDPDMDVASLSVEYLF